MVLFRWAYSPHIVWDVGVFCYGLNSHNGLAPEARTMVAVLGVEY